MVITFYSFKGGVGRTQLLANVAVGLANRGLDLILMDMDLESPGLHTYFHPPKSNAETSRLCDKDLAAAPGLIDILTDHLNGRQEPPDLWNLLRPLDHPNLLSGKGSIRLLPPGRLDAQYPQRVSGFPWGRFYQEAHGYAYIEYLRDSLLSGNAQHRGADLVLVDSRTGLTDVGSICTGQLPDLLVILFGLHAQGIDGARQIARAVETFIDQTNQPRLKEVLLLPARIDESGSIGDRDSMLNRAAEQLARHGTLLDNLEDRVPYDPRMAYGEPVVVGGKEKPTTLSETYERFIERLLKLTGLGNTDGRRAQPTESKAAPIQLLEAVERLKASAFRVHRCWSDLQTGGLPALPDHSRRVMIADRDARTALAQTREFAGALSPDSPLEHLVDPLKAEDWQPFADEVEAFGTEVAEQWIDDWTKRAKTRLIAACGVDGHGIDDRLATLKEAARKEQLSELETRLAEAEQVLRHNSLDERLARCELTNDDLYLVMPDEQKRRGWIAERLIRYQEETDQDDPRIQTELFNVLKLVASALAERPSERPDPAHWSAYDLLCAIMNPDDKPTITTEERDCFHKIGIRLWCNDWRGLIDAPSGADVSWPSGLRARAQLRRFAAAEPAAMRPLVELVGEALAQAEHSPQRHVRLFGMRDQDPVLEQAVIAVGQEPEVQNRREILGGWLSVHRPQGINEALATFLRALAEDGYEAEAFYGVCAALKSAQADIKDDPALWAELGTRYATLLIREDRINQLSALIMAPDFIEILSAGRAGLGLTAYLAGFGAERFGLDTETVALMRTTALHGDGRGRLLPEGMRRWLESQEQQRECPPKTSERIHALAEKARSAMQITVYRKWESAVYFEKSFEDYWLSVYGTLIDNFHPAAQLIANLPDEAPEDWIEHQFRSLRNEGRPVSLPDARAKTKLVTAYDRVREALTNLIEARPAGWSIRQVLDQEDIPSQAQEDLRAWICEEIDDKRQSSEQRVAEIMAEATT